MSRQRRNFSAKFKSDLVIELLKGEKDLNTLAVENNIQPNLLRNWKKEFLDNASAVFDDKREDNLEEKLAEERKEKAEYAKKVGLLDSLSVSGISTAAGSFTAAEEGSADLGWSGVGQYNDLVNPCAMMTLCGTIANRGTQVLPRLLLKETTAAGLSAGHSRAEKHSGTLSSDTCVLLASMMRRNVTEHYGQSSFGDLAVCAKSGTAEVGSDARPHSWFTGFVDDEDHPLASSWWWKTAAAARPWPAMSPQKC